MTGSQLKESNAPDLFLDFARNRPEFFCDYANPNQILTIFANQQLVETSSARY
jgi:hypothetical protein